MVANSTGHKGINACTSVQIYRLPQLPALIGVEASLKLISTLFISYLLSLVCPIKVQTKKFTSFGYQIASGMVSVELVCTHRAAQLPM